MCGRFTLGRSPEAVARAFGLDAVPNFPHRYNIAPLQPAGVVVQVKNATRTSLTDYISSQFERI